MKIFKRRQTVYRLDSVYLGFKPDGITIYTFFRK